MISQYPDLDRSESLLRIDDLLFPRHTTHGMEESLDVEFQGDQLARSAAGPLLWFGAFDFDDPYNLTFTISISGTDMWAPPILRYRPGGRYRIESTVELTAAAPGRVLPADFERQHVAGSIIYRNAQMRAIGTPATFEGAAAEIAWTCYRPVIMASPSAIRQSYKTFSGRDRMTWGLEFREDNILTPGSENDA